MPASAGTPRERPHSRVLSAVRAVIRARVTTGLLTILPIMVTAWLLWVVFGWLRDLSLWVIGILLHGPWSPALAARWGVTADQWSARGLTALPPAVQWSIWGFAVVLTFFVLYLIGVFSANVIGRRIIDWVDYLVSRVPFVKTVYTALKQIVGLFSGQQSQSFQRVALVPFPNELTRSIAFITNTFKDSVTGEELCAAFIATTPNPTTGFVFVLKRTDIIEVDWTVEDAVKAIMSGGILSPQNVTMRTGKAGATSAAGGPQPKPEPGR